MTIFDTVSLETPGMGDTDQMLLAEVFGMDVEELSREDYSDLADFLAIDRESIYC